MEVAMIVDPIQTSWNFTLASRTLSKFYRTKQWNVLQRPVGPNNFLLENPIDPTVFRNSAHYANENVHTSSVFVGSWIIYIWKPLMVIKYWILLFMKIETYMNKYTDIQIIWIAFRFYKFSLSLVPIKPHYNVIYIGKNIRNDPLCIPYY